MMQNSSNKMTAENTLSNTTDNIDETDITTNADVFTTTSLNNNLRVAFTEAQIFYLFVGCLGVVGNGLSIIVFARSKKLMHNLANHFLINQSVIDFLAALSLLATIPVGASADKLSGAGGYIRCVFFDSSLPVWASFLSSTYNLVALSIERWFEVTQPIRHKVYFTHTKAYIMMAIAWASGFIYEIALAVATSAVIKGECYALAIWNDENAKKAYGVITFLTKYIVPIGITIFCYTSMMLSLRRNNFPNAASDARQLRMQKAQKNIFKTLVLVMVAFILCVSYNQFIFLLFNLGLYDIDFSSFVYHLSVGLYFINCCINPIIYIVKYKEFKVSLRKLFCRNRVGPADMNATQTTNSVAAIGPSLAQQKQQKSQVNHNLAVPGKQ